MKHPQLYIKNDKGRYEPYKLPEPDVSETVYKKINGKYEPIGRFYDRDYLNEGIWVVYCDHALCKVATIVLVYALIIAVGRLCHERTHNS